MGRGRGEGQYTGRMRTGGGVFDGATCGPTPQGAVFDSAVCGPTPQGGLSWPVGPIHLLWASAPTERVRITNHSIDQTPGGAEGPLALSPQQCEAWIERAAALLENHRIKSQKNLKIPNLKVLLDFFQKIAVSKGRAFGRASQGAKLPLAAASETPARRNGRNPLTAPLTDAPARGWPAGLRPACRRLRDAGTGDHRRGRVPDRCGPR